MKAINKMKLEIKLAVKISFWDAIKLRIAGKYIKVLDEFIKNIKKMKL